MENYISYIRTYHEEEAREQLINGSNLFQKGNYRQALDSYFAALTILRDSVDLLVSIALVYHITGEYAKAMEYYKKAIAIDPQHHEAWNFIGKIHNVRCNFSEAIASFKKSLECEPDNVMAQINLSLTYVAMGRHTDAIAILEDLLRSHPEDSNAHYALGSSYYAIKKIDKATECFRKASELSPDNKDFLETYVSIQDGKDSGRKDIPGLSYRGQIKK